MRKVIHIVLACFLAMAMLSFSVPVFADDGDLEPPYPGYDISDPYSRDPTKFITQECFGNWMVNTIPDDPNVTSPWEHHGYIAGSPAMMCPYDGPEGQYDYFQTLASESPCVGMWDAAETTVEGRPMFVAALSSADTIADIQTYKGYNLELSDPRITTEARAQEIINNLGKATIWLWSSPDGMESGARQMDMELFYRLAVSTEPYIQKIRDNVIVLYTNQDPDAHERATVWINRYIGTEWDFTSPPFDSHYIGHDFNRDGGTNMLPENQMLIHNYSFWHPQVMLDEHESVPFLYCFTGMPPTYPTVDPITEGEWMWMGSKNVADMTAMGMPNVWHWKYVNFYYPFYSCMPMLFKNTTARFYETYGNGSPSTRVREWTRGMALERDGEPYWYWFGPKPYPYKQVWWSFRNNINYCQTGTLCTLRDLANNVEKVLENFWIRSQHAVNCPGELIQPGSGHGVYPYAWVIPSGQKDMPEVIRMMNNMFENRIEVHQATAEFTIAEGTFSAGSYILRMDQPSSRWIQTVLERQYWPEDVPPPYDATAWTYGLLRGIDTVRVSDPTVLDVAMTDLGDSAVLTCEGTVSSEVSGAYVVDHNSINNIVTLAFGLDGYDMFFAEDSDGVIDVGDIIIPADQAGVYTALTDLVPGLGLTMHSVSEVTVDKHLLNLPRVALYNYWRSSGDTRDAGWTRRTFEEFSVPFTNIDKNVVRAGNLIDTFDVIFMPDIRTMPYTTFGFAKIKDGCAPGSAPDVYDLGPINTDNRCGGLGDEGVAELKAFVDAGGTLILNNGAAPIANAWGFIEGVSVEPVGNMYAPGPVVKIEPALDSPICYGCDETEYIYDDNSPVFIAPAEWTIASYPEDPDEIFASGYLTGEENMAGKAAIVAAPAKDGTGCVILFGTDVTYRWQSWGTFNYLFNAILNWDDLELPYVPLPPPPTNTVGLTIEIPSEEIIAISVEPTEIDFGIVYPGEASDPVAITVENIGDRAVDVGALLDPAGTVFENLTLDDDAYGSWEIDLAVGASDEFDALLEVPPTYTPQGEEEATLIFEAAAS